MNKYEFQHKLSDTIDTTLKYIPKILKSFFNIISFIVYFIVISWVFITNLISLGVLYIGAAFSSLAERLFNDKK